MTCLVPTLFFGTNELVAAYEVPASATNSASSPRACRPKYPAILLNMMTLRLGGRRLRRSCVRASSTSMKAQGVRGFIRNLRHIRLEAQYDRRMLSFQRESAARQG